MWFKLIKTSNIDAALITAEDFQSVCRICMCDCKSTTAFKVNGILIFDKVFDEDLCKHVLNGVSTSFNYNKEKTNYYIKFFIRYTTRKNISSVLFYFLFWFLKFFKFKIKINCLFCYLYVIHLFTNMFLCVLCGES